MKKNFLITRTGVVTKLSGNTYANAEKNTNGKHECATVTTTEIVLCVREKVPPLKYVPANPSKNYALI